MVVLLKEWVVLVIVAWGGTSFTHKLGVEHSQHQGARPILMEGYNCITCYLGNITVEERYEQHVYALNR